MHRSALPRLLTVVGVVALAVTATPLIAGAAVPTSTIGGGTVNEAREYFTDRWSDPMDFSNLEDLAPSRQRFGVDLSIANGRANITASRPFGRIRLVDSAFTPIPNPTIREGNTSPVDQATYRRLSVRMYLDPASLGGDQVGLGMIVFSPCPAANCAGINPQPPAAEGIKPFILRAGWHTYDLDLLGTNDADSGGNAPYGAPWSFGAQRMVGIQFNANGQDAATGAIDWVRLYQPGTTASVSFGGGSGAFDLFYDTDGNTSNNGTPTALGESAGVLAQGVTGTATSVDIGRLPPGTYRFNAQQSGANGSASGPLEVNRRPGPVVLNPDAAGDGDWNRDVKGNSLDFNDATDVFTIANGGPSVQNAFYNVSGGQLNAVGANDDPAVYLSDAADRGGRIDANEWHRLSFRLSFDGPWGTGATAGEGMATRACWFIVRTGSPQCSWEIIPTLGPDTYTIDLSTTTNSPLPPINPASTAGWGGGTAPETMLLRLDPHEDPGARTWHLDWVKLAHDDRVPPGGWSAIQFVDTAYEAGTTADVYADTDPGPGFGTRIFSSMPVQPGVNTLNWDGTGVPAGTYDVVVVLTDPHGASSSSRSTGPVQVVAPPSRDPFGSLDAANPGVGSISVGGWVVDRDAAPGPTNVHVYVDGNGVNIGSASSPRPDIGAIFPAFGADHGFNATIGASPGSHTVCAYGINSGPGGNSLLGCRSVTVPTGSPVGSFDMARWSGAGGIRVAGWAIDPDVSDPVTIHAYVDGVGHNLGSATAPRGDVAAAYPGYGAEHGFGAVIPGVGGGTHTVCLYAINIGGGANSSLGCKVVTVGDGSPYGALDLAWFGGAGAVTVGGWAFDPDTLAPVEVHVYLYGPDGRLVNAKPGILGSLPRADIPLAFDGWENRAFHTVFTPGGLPSGSFTACGYAINAPATSGGNSPIGCRSFVVDGSPFGSFDAANGLSGGRVSVGGWAIDPDAVGATPVHIYVDGQGFNIGPAAGTRPDIGFIGYGTAHGFSQQVTGVSSGSHNVCAYAINSAGPGGNTGLGCRSVTIP